MHNDKNDSCPIFNTKCQYCNDLLDDMKNNDEYDDDTLIELTDEEVTYCYRCGYKFCKDHLWPDQHECRGMVIPSEKKTTSTELPFTPTETKTDSLLRKIMFGMMIFSIVLMMIAYIYETSGLI
jgi:hypothetical protein